MHIYMFIFRTIFSISILLLLAAAKMALSLKAITQETFDSVVQENVDDFEMEPEEAVSDAVEQFTSQGIKLNMIMKCAPGPDGHVPIALTNSVKRLIEEGGENGEAMLSNLTQLDAEFSKDLANRYQAFKIADAHNVLYNGCVAMREKHPDLFQPCLQAFSSLINGQPDLISPKGIEFMLDCLAKSEDISTVLLILKTLKYSCTGHESNREYFVTVKGIGGVLDCIERLETDDLESVILEACACLRTLTLDDDVRATFGKAHEYTKAIVTEYNGIQRLFRQLKTFHENATVAADLCRTINRLMVRNEFCQQGVDLGGLDTIASLMSLHMETQAMVRSCLSLVKVMSRNDDVKVAIVNSELLDQVLDTLNRHSGSAPICEATFALIASLSLRNTTHCDIMMKKKAAPLIVYAMQVHPDHAGVQKQACMAVRNLVARTRNHVPAFIECGVEALIRKARQDHQKILGDESHAALRDLDLEVELKERWRGEKTPVMMDDC